MWALLDLLSEIGGGKESWAVEEETKFWEVEMSEDEFEEPEVEEFEEVEEEEEFEDGVEILEEELSLEETMSLVDWGMKIWQGKSFAKTGRVVCFSKSFM